MTQPLLSLRALKRAFSPQRLDGYKRDWDREVWAGYEKIIDTLRWMNPSVATATAATNPFPAVYQAGSTAYRVIAERLLLGRAEEEAAAWPAQPNQ